MQKIKNITEENIQINDYLTSICKAEKWLTD